MLESLKIIPLDKIVPFETALPGRSQHLVNEIEKEGRLRNPLLVLPLGNRFLLLDDAAFLDALTQLGVNDVIVQMAGASQVTVRPWQRILEKWKLAEFIDFCARYPRQIRLMDKAEGTLGVNEAEIKVSDGSHLRIQFCSRSYMVRADLCIKLNNILTRDIRNYKAKIDLDNNNLFREFPDAAAAFFPPLFSLRVLGGIANHGLRLPQGLVRVDQPGRVLGIDFSLNVLREKDAVVEKEDFLRSLIKLRMADDRTAYYDGFVFMFNY